MNIQAKECIQRIHVYMHFNYICQREVILIIVLLK